jgi:hypothetical protein
LIYVNSPSPVLVFNKNMEKDSNIIAIAKAALKEFGADAVAAMEERVLDHEQAGELEGARLWRRVVEALREMM